MKRKRPDPLPFDIERFKEMIRPLESLPQAKHEDQPKQQPNQTQEELK